jgi:hypothetical protein
MTSEYSERSALILGTLVLLVRRMRMAPNLFSIGGTPLDQNENRHVERDKIRFSVITVYHSFNA